MTRRLLTALALNCGGVAGAPRSAPYDWRSARPERSREASQPAPGSVRVIRFASNPLVTVKSSPSLGANVNVMTSAASTHRAIKRGRLSIMPL
jgi:hypothetical protein